MMATRKNIHEIIHRPEGEKNVAVVENGELFACHESCAAERVANDPSAVVIRDVWDY